MRVFVSIGVASMLALLTVVPGRAEQAPTQSNTFERSGSTQPISPVAVVSWVSVSGSGGMLLDLAVVWRGSPGWFMVNSHGGSSGGSGGGSGAGYRTAQRYGNVEVGFTLKDSPLIVTIGNNSIDLGDHNVVLVDGVDDPSGPKILKSLRIDPEFSNRRELEAVLGRSAEVVSFLRCDVKLDNPAQQRTIDIFCGRLKGG
jgi:hypothetical protein